MTAQDYAPLLEKIRARIRSWTARFLSFAGRMQLISSVIFSLTNFWISAFRLPKKCIEEIDSLCSAFLWSGPELNTKKAKVSWKDCCKPKEEGGLGLRSISEANDVSCLKLVWRILSSADSLWVRWIRRYLIRKGSFWSVKENSSLGSWMWKKILKYRDTAAEFAKVEVHSGSSTSFWYDSWSPHGRLIEKTQGRGVLDMGIRINDTVEKVVNSHRRRRRRGAVYTLIEEEIHKLRTRGLDQREDTQLWKAGEDVYKESFSSLETWKLTRTATTKVDWHRSIWFQFNTPKYSFMAWIAIQNRLPTGDRVSNWNTTATTTCCLCSAMLETRNHLFFQCSFSEEIWRNLTHKLLSEQYTTDWDEIIHLINDQSWQKIHLFLLRYVFQAALSTI